MISLGKIFRNAFFVFISNVLNKLLVIVFVIYAARLLGPVEFGYLGLINAWVLSLAIFQNLGIGLPAVREIARNQTNVHEIFNEIISLRLAISLVMYVLLAMVILVLDYPDNIQRLILMSGLSLPIVAVRDSYRVLYIGLERMKVPSLASVISSLFITLASILALMNGYGLEGIVVVSVVGTGVTTLMAGFWVRRSIYNYKFSRRVSHIMRLIRLSIPWSIMAFFHMLQRHSAVILLSKLSMPHTANLQLGYYNAAFTIPNGLMPIPQSIRTALLPSVVSSIDDNDQVLRAVRINTKLIYLALAYPLLVASLVFPEAIVLLLFGESYLAAAPIFSILGCAFSMLMMVGPIETAISATKDISRLVPWIASGSIISVICAAALIPLYGGEGAAAGVLIGILFGAYFRVHLFRSIFTVDLDISNVVLRSITPLVLLLLLLISLRIIVQSNILLVLISCFAYLVTIFGLKIISASERTLLKKGFHKVGFKLKSILR